MGKILFLLLFFPLGCDSHDDGDVEEEESGFIDVMLALREEYGLTRNHIKAILMVSTRT